ncbi:MAG: hypothetical protein WD988_04175 [Candidatus Curtissbacteria bacterium]
MTEQDLNLGVLVKGLRSRNMANLIPALGDKPSEVVLGTDIEGPAALGDTIDEAMVEKTKPTNDRLLPDPIPYGHIIYEQTWQWFSNVTVPDRRPQASHRREQLSLAQEGTDTIFTLPLLLAQGVDYKYLEDLTMQSKRTPGATEFFEDLCQGGTFTVGITTAPGRPYEAFFRKYGGLQPQRIIGSPFPIDEARKILIQEGRYDEEIALAKAFIVDCIQIIHSNYQVPDSSSDGQKELSASGRSLLQQRAARFYSQELGVSFDPIERKNRTGEITVLGQIIEAVGIVGDRAKAAVALTALRQHGTPDAILSAIGDGANDRVMLSRIPYSIGVNGAEAAQAAKIAVVTPDMRHVTPIFDQLRGGERNIARIVAYAQRAVGSAAIIVMGGKDIDPVILAEARKMKKHLRGENITY